MTYTVKIEDVELEGLDTFEKAYEAAISEMEKGNIPEGAVVEITPIRSDGSIDSYNMTLLEKRNGYLRARGE